MQFGQGLVQVTGRVRGGELIELFSIVSATTTEPLTVDPAMLMVVLSGAIVSLLGLDGCIEGVSDLGRRHDIAVDD